MTLVYPCTVKTNNYFNINGLKQNRFQRSVNKVLPEAETQRYLHVDKKY